MIRILAVVGLLVALVIGAYWAGGRDDRAQDLLIDKEGAEDVRNTVEDTIDGIDVDADPDALLRETDGLRDD